MKPLDPQVFIDRLLKEPLLINERAKLMTADRAPFDYLPDGFTPNQFGELVKLRGEGCEIEEDGEILSDRRNVEIFGALIIVRAVTQLYDGDFEAHLACRSLSGETVEFRFAFVEFDVESVRLARTLRGSGVHVVPGKEQPFADYIKHAIAHMSKCDWVPGPLTAAEYDEKFPDEERHDPQL